jgi:transcription elongation GreA/GreB family factor
MSRAFVNEDNVVEDLPDRPVSPHVNYVTTDGLGAIDAAVEAAHRTFREAQARGDRDALARSGRELRYWNARRASAQLVTLAADCGEVVQFGSTVTFIRDDGRRQTFRIVGEDEANPSRGTVSYVSPLAKALLGKSVGDVVPAAAGDIEIVKIG